MRFLLGLLAGAVVAALLVLLAVRVVLPAMTGSATTRAVGEFGAAPAAGVDDTDALRRAIAASAPGDTVTFPPGRYEHDDVLVVDAPGVRLVGPGATLAATVEQASAVRVAADDVLVEGLTFAVAPPSRRFSEPAQQKLWISGHHGVVLRDVVVTGSAAAGIFVDGGADGFRIERPRVADTRADGIHITGGAHDGEVVDPVVARTGDDGIAVVSYDRDADTCSAITVSHPRVLGTTWGRGLSVVGGRDVRFTDVLVEDTDAAAVYIAVEGDPFYTRAVQDVTVAGGTLRRANTNADIDHGAVVVYGGRPASSLAGVRVEGLAVEGTRPGASQDIGVIDAGTTPTDLSFTGLRVTGGPRVVFGGNVPRTRYDVTD